MTLFRAIGDRFLRYKTERMRTDRFPAGWSPPGIRRQNAENEKIFFPDRVCTFHDAVRMRQEK